MRTLIQVVRHYQDFDPVTGQFSGVRAQNDYAQLLGIAPSTLSRFYAGKTTRPWLVAAALLRLYPQAGGALIDAMAETNETKDTPS